METLAQVLARHTRTGDLYDRLPDLDYRFDMRQYEAFIQDLQGEYETDPAQTGGAALQHGLTAYVPASAFWPLALRSRSSRPSRSRRTNAGDMS